MTDPTLTHLYFLLDRSGSMQTIADDTRGGFDAFIAEQRTQRGECLVTLAQFDDRYEEVFVDRPVADVGPLDLQPRGTTALLDSIGRLVTSAGERLSRLPEDQRPGTVIVGIMTDGYENASQEWTHAAIKELVEQQTTQYAWQLMYMGADQDAIEVGMSLGVAADRSVTYARGKSRQAMQAMSGKVRQYREAIHDDVPNFIAASYLAYTPDERVELGEGPEAWNQP